MRYVVEIGNTIWQKRPNPWRVRQGMDEKRVNNTEPVVQVRLRVMIGNFHGA